ncbi:hypothetical protein ACH4ZU_11860 [Streptomyces sp. NPDC020472]|uniref:hypothetical protein n=1 Tax=Streptomyces sp. NPDC020472 TaxID=3365075 RepID=UPI0037A7581C
MSKAVLISWSDPGEQHFNEVVRDFKTGRALMVRCPLPECRRLVQVTRQRRLASHTPVDSARSCDLSNSEVYDRTGLRKPTGTE